MKWSVYTSEFSCVVANYDVIGPSLLCICLALPLSRLMFSFAEQCESWPAWLWQWQDCYPLWLVDPQLERKWALSWTSHLWVARRRGLESLRHPVLDLPKHKWDFWRGLESQNHLRYLLILTIRSLDAEVVWMPVWFELRHSWISE